MMPPGRRFNVHEDDDFEAASLVEMTALEPAATEDAGPLGLLTVLDRRQVQVGSRLNASGKVAKLRDAIPALPEALSSHLRVERFEVIWRAAGLARPGAVAHWNWPRYSTRVGLGIETSLAHAVVDHLLGFSRFPAEGRLQVTPVEWGILTYLATRILARLDLQPGSLGPYDLVLDRLGPDPFDIRDLGPIATLVWTIRVGRTAGSVRLWVPESLVAEWLVAEPTLNSTEFRNVHRFFDLESVWRAEAGTIDMPRGLARLRRGMALPLHGTALGGSLDRLVGDLQVVSDASDCRYVYHAQPDPDSVGARVVLMSRLQKVPRPREALPVSSATPPPPESGSSPIAPTDVPVTLVVELGRLNLPLRRLADLRPGDVLELGRHAREPVELTSGGRLIARGELVQIDTELGLRVTNVFL